MGGGGGGGGARLRKKKESLYLVQIEQIIHFIKSQSTMTIISVREIEFRNKIKTHKWFKKKKEKEGGGGEACII